MLLPARSREDMRCMWRENNPVAAPTSVVARLRYTNPALTQEAS